MVAKENFMSAYGFLGLGIGLIFLFGSIFYFTAADTRVVGEEIVPCYDRYAREIVDQDCIRNVREIVPRSLDTFFNYVGASSILLIISGLMIGIGELFKGSK